MLDKASTRLYATGYGETDGHRHDDPPLGAAKPVACDPSRSLRGRGRRRSTVSLECHSNRRAAGPRTPLDIISRIVANEVAEAEGWRVIVENHPGALQTIAMADVARRPADGYALLVMSLPMMVTPSLMPNAGLRPDTDFAPVVKLSRSYTALVTTPSLPVKTISELVSLLKSKPEKLNFSSAGFGTPSHLMGELFQLQAGVRATHVPYQQFPQALADLMSGTNHYMFVTTLPVVDLIATGKLRGLAVTAPKRIAALENLPTVVEAGFPGLVMEDWVGFAVKKGTRSKPLHGSMRRSTARSQSRRFARPWPPSVQKPQEVLLMNSAS